MRVVDEKFEWSEWVDFEIECSEVKIVLNLVK